MVSARKPQDSPARTPVDYPDPESRSAALYRQAGRVLTDGGSRSTIRMAPYSIYVQEARGKTILDVDGNSLVDLNNNYTSLIHGHSHPAIVEAVSRQLHRGAAFSFGSEAELLLAELICDRCENFDKIRFMNSGTEAVMNGIKAARAYTGKPAIAKCENAYHGSYDFAEVSLGVEPTALDHGDPESRRYARGAPQAVLDDVVVIPFNQVDIARRILEQNAERLAAVLIDPFGTPMGRTAPSDEFLAMLQQFCAANPCLFLADEVVAFRAGPAGTQGARGIEPDLTALGKIIGGGLPVGAVAGKAGIMAVFETQSGKAALPHGGTFNANPLTMVAGHAAMQLMTDDEFARLNDLGDRFREGIREVLRLTDTDGVVHGQYSMFAITANDVLLDDTIARGHVYASNGLHLYLARNGYWMTPGLTGVLSTAMDTADVDPFCQTLNDGIRTLRDRTGSV